MDSLIKINAESFGEAAKELISKVSDGVGGIAKPWQMKRVAKADIAVRKMNALAEQELTEIEGRAVNRVVAQETRKQRNIENITYRSTSHLNEENDIKELDEDWIADFFDKCENVSAEYMQEMWARVLAGEANKSGSYSKKTIDIISKIDRESAVLFSRLCSFIAFFYNKEELLVDYESMSDLLIKKGLNFLKLQEFETDGLINFSSLTGYGVSNPFFTKDGDKNKSGELFILYHDNVSCYAIESIDRLKTGNIVLTRYGREVATICDIEPDVEVYELMKGYIEGQGFKSSDKFKGAAEEILVEVFRKQLDLKIMRK
ncbi:DUF2806 domain-containing protein [Salinicola endophyticus]|uniref:DUF2806 domain-containing protein n=1 Tax=Salinicola endophyticus TaxID=1949083 RepID=UPI00130052AC|nr:DUF2806 domain-containing protein [Salinicola endophyticus]